MPAEAIHLSALADSLAAADPATRAALAGDDELLRLSRLGAVLLDFPYFDRFALGVLRYVAGLPLTTSTVGDALHRREPVRIGKHLLARAHELRAHGATRRDGDRLLALGLGYLSHVAVDASMHPLVNRLADERAARLHDRAARQHSEVEKFHSILFHEERLGYDFMGDPRIATYIGVDVTPLSGAGHVAGAVRAAMGLVLDAAPTDAVQRRWTRGYAQYVALLASWFGGRIMPAAVKAAVRGEVYDAPWGRFVDQYDRAVARSRTCIEAGMRLVEDRDDERFDRLVPEGSIDDPPHATDADRGVASAP